MSADSPTIPVGPGSVCAECGAFYPEIPPEPPWRARDDGAALCSVCGPVAAQVGKAWHHKADPKPDPRCRCSLAFRNVAASHSVTGAHEVGCPLLNLHAPPSPPLPVWIGPFDVPRTWTVLQVESVTVRIEVSE